MRQIGQHYRERGHVDKHLQTQDELAALVKMAQGGDEAALDDLCWRMHPLVYNLSIKYGSKGARYKAEQRQEILQEAWAGLMDAVWRYDPVKVGKDGKPKRFWTVAGYRIGRAIDTWQSQNSGALPLTRKAWQQASIADKALERAGMEQWEDYPDHDLREATGVFSAGVILRARKSSNTLFEDDADAFNQSQSAESEYMDAHEADTDAELAAWVLGLSAIPADHWEAATYWKLEQLGLAGELEAQDVIDTWLTEGL